MSQPISVESLLLLNPRMYSANINAIVPDNNRVVILVEIAEDGRVFTITAYYREGSWYSTLAADYKLDVSSSIFPILWMESPYQPLDKQANEYAAACKNNR